MQDLGTMRASRGARRIGRGIIPSVLGIAARNLEPKREGTWQRAGTTRSAPFVRCPQRLRQAQNGRDFSSVAASFGLIIPHFFRCDELVRPWESIDSTLFHFYHGVPLRMGLHRSGTQRANTVPLVYFPPFLPLVDLRARARSNNARVPASAW